VADFTPRMPVVDVVPDVAARFAEARRLLVDPAAGRRIAVITPGRMIMLLACPSGRHRPYWPPSFSIAPPLDVVSSRYRAGCGGRMTAAVLCRLPPEDELRRHSVALFEGHPSALGAGCRGADLLLVDAAMAPFLQADWPDVAHRAMRTPRILILHRDGRMQQVVKQA
jgi:hypothetical protein